MPSFFFLGFGVPPPLFRETVRHLVPPFGALLTSPLPPTHLDVELCGHPLDRSNLSPQLNFSTFQLIPTDESNRRFAVPFLE